jgi:hypothetical protein
MFQPRRAHVRVFPSTFTHVTGLRFPRRSGRSRSSLTSPRLAAGRAALPRAGKCKETSSRALAEKAVTRRRAARLHAASRPACGGGEAWRGVARVPARNEPKRFARSGQRKLPIVDAPRSRSCYRNGTPFAFGIVRGCCRACVHGDTLTVGLDRALASIALCDQTTPILR